MTSIAEIMNMIDWHMPLEIQSRGRDLAKSIHPILPFIQPLTPEHSKNVWENCAVILAERKDEELKPYLDKLLEWIQDLNWPGALCILNRLQKYSDNSSIHIAISTCVEKAKSLNDETWELNLSTLIQERQ